MGLIKNVVGALSGLIQTLFSVLLGIFGVGKKSEYFLEVDDSKAPSAPESVAESEKVAPTPVEPVAATKEPEKVPVAVAAIPAAVVQAPQAAQSTGSADGEMTFATDFLVNPRLTNTSRRRPGPSLSPFANMVKDMKRSASMG
ncbi:MAG: hypothetical protein ACFB0C_20495 [Leptolyngbyaceae cyanobacterium]